MFTLLQKYSKELSTAITRLAAQSTSLGVESKQLPTEMSADSQTHKGFQSKRDILSLLTKMRALVAEPTDFIQKLANQVCAAFPTPIPLGT